MLLMDGKSPGDNQSHRGLFDELAAVAKRFEVERAGIVLRSSRSGLREVDLVERPACVEESSYPQSGVGPGVLVLKEGAQPGLYRRQPDLTVAVGPARPVPTRPH